MLKITYQTIQDISLGEIQARVRYSKIVEDFFWPSDESFNIIFVSQLMHKQFLLNVTFKYVCCQRSKRFRLVLELRKTKERDFRFCPHEK